MAFANGHTAPVNFVSGQLRDGSTFGLIDASNYNNQAVKFKIDLRWYKGTLIAVVTVLKADGTTVLEQPQVKESQYLLNIAQLALPNTVQALKDLAPLVANAAKLQSIGVGVNQLVPVNVTNDLIPFQQSADGVVTSFTSPADVAKQQVAAATQQQNLLNTIASNLNPNSTPAVTNADGTTTPGTGMSKTTKIIIAVVAALVVGGIIYMATKKKKGGSRR